MSRRANSLLPWLKLLRVANLPSAISNILMGYLLVNQSWTPAAPLLLLVVASACIYMAGMVLNDAFDFTIDLEQRPHRPLPSGAISKSSAWTVGFGLLLAGVIAACTATWASNGFSGDGIEILRTPFLAILLSVLVVLYDGPLKRTILSPFLMGGCRTCNILMGASVFSTTTAVIGEEASLVSNGILGIPLLVWWIAGAMGLLISGATLLGRNEASETQSRGPLLIATTMIVVSFIAIATCVYCPTSELQGLEVTDRVKNIFPLFVAFMAISILRRVLQAVTAMTPKTIQSGVVSVLRSIIIFDAAFCYLARPDQVIYALVVLALLAPTMLLGRYMAST